MKRMAKEEGLLNPKKGEEKGEENLFVNHKSMTGNITELMAQ